MAIDPSKLSFSSNFRYERINKKGNVGFSVGPFGGGSSSTTINIIHNLGYKPYVKLFYVSGGSVIPLFAGPTSYSVGATDLQVDSVFINTVNITLVLENFGAGSTSGTIYYRIYEEPLS